MCTLSWWRGAEGEFGVFFNRDEKKTRAAAEMPAVHERDGVRFLSPRDPDGGGTWMLANEFGLIVCLLNRWHEEPAGGRTWQSRGRLVWSLAGAGSADAVAALLSARDLGATKPFSLWALDPGGERGWDWTQGGLREVPPSLPVTSSSFRFEAVAAARRERFASVARGDRAGLAAFHEGEGEPSAYTVRMCRPDAQTMSRSEVRVGTAEVTWRYLAEQRDLAGPPGEFWSSLRRHSS